MLLAPAHARGDWALLAASLFLAAASYLDDVRQWPFWPKLAAQIAASAAVLAGGMALATIAIPGAGLVHLGVLGLAAGLIWLLFTINAVNFMDGLNGLAAGSAAIGCLVLACATPAFLGWPERLIVAGVAGFLPFNYPAARIFMGDVGSQFLGLTLAALALRHAADPALAWILPLSLAPMLMDAAFTLCRRLAAGAQLTQAHRGHLYQVAQRAGVPAWLVTAIYWAMAGWGGWCGLRCGQDQSAAWLIAALLPFPAWGLYAAARARSARLTW